MNADGISFVAASFFDDGDCSLHPQDSRNIYSNNYPFLHHFSVFLIGFLVEEREVRRGIRLHRYFLVASGCGDFERRFGQEEVEVFAVVVVGDESRNEL